MFLRLLQVWCSEKPLNELILQIVIVQLGSGALQRLFRIRHQLISGGDSGYLKRFAGWLWSGAARSELLRSVGEAIELIKVLENNFFNDLLDRLFSAIIQRLDFLLLEDKLGLETLADNHLGCLTLKLLICLITSPYMLAPGPSTHPDSLLLW